MSPDWMGWFDRNRTLDGWISSIKLVWFEVPVMKQVSPCVASQSCLPVRASPSPTLILPIPRMHPTTSERRPEGKKGRAGGVRGAAGLCLKNDYTTPGPQSFQVQMPWRALLHADKK